MYLSITKDITAAVGILKSGRLVAFPTGTSYGLAADALNPYAIQRLRNLKNRPEEKAFTLFITESLWPKFLDLTPQEKKFLNKGKNQPITLLVKPKFSPSSNGERAKVRGDIGLRVIDHPLMQQLADAFQGPLTATSANISGQDPCFSPDCIQGQFPGKINEATYDLSLGLILDAGQLPSNKPSKIIKLENGKTVEVRS